VVGSEVDRAHQFRDLFGGEFQEGAGAEAGGEFDMAEADAHQPADGDALGFPEPPDGGRYD